MKLDIHKQQTQMQLVVFIYMCSHIHIHVTIIIREEAVHLRVMGGICKEESDLEGAKGEIIKRQGDVIIF